MGFMFTWLRLSSLRQLDWYRRSNYQSKDIAHVQKHLAERMAFKVRLRGWGDAVHGFGRGGSEGGTAGGGRGGLLCWARRGATIRCTGMPTGSCSAPVVLARQAACPPARQPHRMLLPDCPLPPHPHPPLQARSAEDPLCRLFARLSLAGLPRGGGNGDDIRMGILNIMRANGIKEGHRPVSSTPAGTAPYLAALRGICAALLVACPRWRGLSGRRSAACHGRATAQGAMSLGWRGRSCTPPTHRCYSLDGPTGD